MLDIKTLNERAAQFDCEVREEELIGHPFNMGGGPWCRFYRNGVPLHKFTWRAEEVSQWLSFRERAAR